MYRIIIVILFLASCSTPSNQKDSESTNEEAMVDSIVTVIDQEKEALAAETQEALSEVDSLLEKI